MWVLEAFLLLGLALELFLVRGSVLEVSLEQV